MTRQTSFQLTEATEAQLDYLKQAGFGGTTDVIRIAIDRMAQQEGMNTMTIQIEHLSRHTVRNSQGVDVPTSNDNVWAFGLDDAPMGYYALLNGHTAVGDGTRETARLIAAEVGNVVNDKEAKVICQRYAKEGMCVSEWTR